MLYALCLRRFYGEIGALACAACVASEILDDEGKWDVTQEYKFTSFETKRDKSF